MGPWSFHRQSQHGLLSLNNARHQPQARVELVFGHHRRCHPRLAGAELLDGPSYHFARRIGSSPVVARLGRRVVLRGIDEPRHRSFCHISSATQASDFGGELIYHRGTEITEF